MVYQSHYLAAALSVALHKLQEQVKPPVYLSYLAHRDKPSDGVKNIIPVFKGIITATQVEQEKEEESSN